MRSLKKRGICLIILVLLTFSVDIGASSYVPSKIAAPIGELGVASYYSYECANQPMANGKPFDPEKRTCASWFYKFGTVLTIKSLDTGKVTEVTVTDRGPNKRLVKEGRIIDLSKRAFEDISPLEKGLTHVLVTVKSKPASS